MVPHILWTQGRWVRIMCLWKKHYFSTWDKTIWCRSGFMRNGTILLSNSLGSRSSGKKRFLPIRMAAVQEMFDWWMLTQATHKIIAGVERISMSDRVFLDTNVLILCAWQCIPDKQRKKQRSNREKLQIPLSGVISTQVMQEFLCGGNAQTWRRSALLLKVCWRHFAVFWYCFRFPQTLIHEAIDLFNS